MSEQRRTLRTRVQCRIKISHPSFGDCLAQTQNLSDHGVYVKHPSLTTLRKGMQVSGQVQHLPIAAPVLQMEVVRVDAEGVGLRFIKD